jgi:hypothetical protein
LVQVVNLDDREKPNLAGTLGLTQIPSEVAGMIAEAIAAYRTTEAGSADTTVANILAAISELRQSGRGYIKAVTRIAHEQSGVDYTTHGILQPLAKAVLENEAGAKEALADAADRRASDLKQHKRVAPPTEAFRLFCGVLRLIYNHVASPPADAVVEENWRRCRRFAIEVFIVAGIDHAYFEAHPERLTEYLGTDVSVD